PAAAPHVRAVLAHRCATRQRTSLSYPKPHPRRRETGMIHFACACGRDLRVPDEMAGRQVRCPACQQVQFVPGEHVVENAPPQAVQPEVTRRRPRLSDDSEEPYDGEPQTTSAKAGWSLGLGISSFLCLFFTGIPAVILGVLALGEIGRSRGRTGGN